MTLKTPFLPMTSYIPAYRTHTQNSVMQRHASYANRVFEAIRGFEVFGPASEPSAKHPTGHRGGGAMMTGGSQILYGSYPTLNRQRVGRCQNVYANDPVKLIFASYTCAIPAQHFQIFQRVLTGVKPLYAGIDAAKFTCTRK